MWIWVFLTTILVFLILDHLKRRKKYGSLSLLPGIHPRFFVGGPSWVIKIYSRKSEHHPGVYILERILGENILHYKEGAHCFWIGLTPIVVFNSPDIIEEVLTSNVSLDKSYEYDLMHRWLGLGLLTSTGSKWRSRRKLLTPCFHFRILEDFLPSFHEQSQILVNKLKCSVNEEFVDILSLVILCTLDIVCDTVMGVSIGAQSGKNSEYVTAIHNLGDFFNQRTIRPWLWSDRLFNMTSSGRCYDNYINIVHSFTNKVINQKKESIFRDREKEHPKKRQALMDLLLDLHINGNQISEEDIREEVDTFMFEGHDTTAMGITYALYCIGLNPDVQHKIHEELDSIFGTDSSRIITYDDTRDMKYLERVLKESQRVFPSVPIIGRTLKEDLYCKGVRVPAGTTIHCNIYSLHRRPDSFPNPEIFDPDRFSQENILNRHPFAYIPFSAGPRNCIGQKFALLEEKVIIGNILRHFQVFSVDPRDRFHTMIAFTLKPAQPVRIRFQPRNSHKLTLTKPS